MQGMRVALSAEVTRTHEEMVERMLHTGLAYTDAVTPDTSLVVCNDPETQRGKGFQARELGVPMITDQQFMVNVDNVVCGAGLHEFVAADGRQFALF